MGGGWVREGGGAIQDADDGAVRGRVRRGGGGGCRLGCRRC